MVEIKGYIDTKTLNKLIEDAPKEFYQVNIYLPMDKFNRYVWPTQKFRYQMSGSIEGQFLFLESESYKDKIFNYVGSDYYKEISIEYIDDRNYDALKEYVLGKDL